MAAWTTTITPVNFYTTTRPNAPMTWYPASDPECFLYPHCMNLFYAPNIIFENGTYKMWTTVDDMIFYADSTDGLTWRNGRIVMKAIQTNWENDGICETQANGSTLCGGLSNPVVIKNVTSGWVYTMYYTAGPTVNTSTNGGLGVAFSNDGINWTRYSGNPIRKFVGGGTFAANAMRIGNKRYVFFYGGGNYSQNNAPPLRAAEDLGNGTNLGMDIITFGDTQVSKTAYPIAYDTQTNSCLMYNRGVTGADWGAAGPTKFQIYTGSDCFNNLGTQVAEITPTLTGSSSNGIAGTGIKERDGNGQIIQTGSLRLYFGSGNIWGGWHPESVNLTGENPTGALNSPTCNEISGWALDKDDATQPITIHFYYDVLDSSHFLSATLANDTWPGLCAYPPLNLQQPCNDNHKFSLPTPSSLKDGKTHTIYAFGINLNGTLGGNNQLSGSPKTITCSQTSGITELRQLLGAFTNIIDYTKLVGNFGK